MTTTAERQAATSLLREASRMRAHEDGRMRRCADAIVGVARLATRPPCPCSAREDIYKRKPANFFCFQSTKLNVRVSRVEALSLLMSFCRIHAGEPCQADAHVGSAFFIPCRGDENLFVVVGGVGRRGWAKAMRLSAHDEVGRWQRGWMLASLERWRRQGRQSRGPKA